MPKRRIPQENVPCTGMILFRKTDEGEICASMVLPDDENGTPRAQIKLTIPFLCETLTLKPGGETHKINGIKAARPQTPTWSTEKPKSVNFFCTSGGEEPIRIQISRKKLRESLEHFNFIPPEEKKGAG